MQEGKLNKPSAAREAGQDYICSHREFTIEKGHGQGYFCSAVNCFADSIEECQRAIDRYIDGDSNPQRLPEQASGKPAGHTAGPWRTDDSVTHANDTFRHSINADDRIIAWTLRHYDRDENGLKTSAIDEANARLISAAPELLEACKAAVEFCRYIAEENAEPSLQDVIDMRVTALAAIAKATGGAK